MVEHYIIDNYYLTDESIESATSYCDHIKLIYRTTKFKNIPLFTTYNLLHIFEDYCGEFAIPLWYVYGLKMFSEII